MPTSYKIVLLLILISLTSCNKHKDENDKLSFQVQPQKSVDCGEEHTEVVAKFKNKQPAITFKWYDNEECTQEVFFSNPHNHRLNVNL